MLRNFLLSALFAVLTAVGGILSITVIPPVPFTMQSFFVLMSGLFLGPKYGPLSQILYIIMGLAGAPVLAGGTGGLHHVLVPSFGFLVGFIPMSWAAGMLVASAERKKKWNAAPFLKYSLICVAATAMLYIVALPLFYLNMRYITKTPVSMVRAVQLAFAPFVVPDLIKAVVAGGLAAKTISTLRGADLLPKQR